MTPEERREYMREWRQSHPDYYRNYYKDNKDVFILKLKHKYATDAEYRERILKRAKERYQNDNDFRQKRIAYQREYKRMMKLASKDETNE